LQKLYAKGKEQREREIRGGSSALGALEGLTEGNSRNVEVSSAKKAATAAAVDFKITPNDGLDMEAHGARPSKTTKKAWSELDKYIELLLDSKQTDQSVFVYLNPNSDSGNPYDLTVCQYHDRDE